MAQARVTPVAQSRLKELQRALQKDFGYRSSAEDIVSALICEISVPQLAGILIAYNKATAETPTEDSQNS